MCPAVLSCPLMQTSPADSYWTRDEVFGQVSLGPASRAGEPQVSQSGAGHTGQCPARPLHCITPTCDIRQGCEDIKAFYLIEIATYTTCFRLRMLNTINANSLGHHV